MARDMNINPKSAFVLLYKLHEAMGAIVIDGGDLAGEVEVDGAYFGSRTRPANRLADRRLAPRGQQPSSCGCRARARPWAERFRGLSARKATRSP
jgi:hypothetical protein